MAAFPPIGYCIFLLLQSISLAQVLRKTHPVSQSGFFMLETDTMPPLLVSQKSRQLGYKIQLALVVTSMLNIHEIHRAPKLTRHDDLRPCQSQLYLVPNFFSKKNNMAPEVTKLAGHDMLRKQSNRWLNKKRWVHRSHKIIITTIDGKPLGNATVDGSEIPNSHLGCKKPGK